MFCPNCGTHTKNTKAKKCARCSRSWYEHHKFPPATKPLLMDQAGEWATWIMSTAFGVLVIAAFVSGLMGTCIDTLSSEESPTQRTDAGRGK